jgi:hypothetical protein
MNRVISIVGIIMLSVCAGSLLAVSFRCDKRLGFLGVGLIGLIVAPYAYGILTRNRAGKHSHPIGPQRLP